MEAKLTEGGFQTARPELVLRYRDLQATFEVDELPIHLGIIRATNSFAEFLPLVIKADVISSSVTLGASTYVRLSSR